MTVNENEYNEGWNACLSKTDLRSIWEKMQDSPKSESWLAGYRAAQDYAAKSWLRKMIALTEQGFTEEGEG